MKNLKQSLKMQLKQIPNKLSLFILIVSLLGFIDASYLTVQHYRGVVPPCSIVNGCEKVLTSEYSTIFNIPVALIGAVFYFIILATIFAYLDTKNTKLLKPILILIFLGFVASLGFLFIQAFVLDSYCLYCLGSAITSTTLFIISFWIFSKYKATDTLSV
jgi:uncharacterized membrane protein